MNHTSITINASAASLIRKITFVEKRSGSALYVYSLASHCTGVPAVQLTPPVPLRVLPYGPCTWIVLTGLPLPASVRWEVRLAGATLRRSFTTAA